MARFYSNEALRDLGHEVVTSMVAGNANQAIPDEDVLAFAVSRDLTILTLNRRHFVRLHNQSNVKHPGIVVCSYDPDFHAQAPRIHDAVSALESLQGILLRINRAG